MLKKVQKIESLGVAHRVYYLLLLLPFEVNCAPDPAKGSHHAHIAGTNGTYVIIAQVKTIMS